MINTVSSEEQGTTTVRGDNPGPGQPFSQVRTEKDKNLLRTQKPAERRQVPSPLLSAVCVQVLRFLLRSRVGRAWSET